MQHQVTAKRGKSFADLWKRARRDQSGVSAVEFALIAPLFLAMLFGILEVGMVFLRQMLLDHALQVATRSLLVGQAQKDAKTMTATQVETNFRNALCNASFFYKGATCADLKFQVLIGSEIGSNLDARAPIGTGATPSITINSAHSFNPLPTQSEDVVVRVYAPANVLLARINGFAASVKGTNIVLVSSTAFTVEPFTP